MLFKGKRQTVKNFASFLLIMEEKPIEALIEKIAKECEEASADKWTITKIVKELSAEDSKSIKIMRKKALEMLKKLDPKAAAIYTSFQRMQVRTSSQLIEGFDRGNIIKSLLRETNVPRGVAEKIGHEVEEKIKDLEIESISTSLIREMVNVKLLEYGHENIRNQYTRLGLPVFEAGKKTEKKPYNNMAIMTEYNLLRIIPSKLGRMHLSSEIFIGELQDFSTKPVAINIIPKAGENPKDTVFNMLEKANKASRFYSWRPNFFGVNATIASNVGKKTAKEAAMLFARASKAIFLNKKAVPAFNTMTLFESESFGKEIERESMVAAANTVLKLGSEDSEPVFENAIAIDTKYKLKLLHKHMPKTVLNCRNTEPALVNGIALEGKGICTFAAINLTLIALGCKRNETAFFEEIGKKAKAVSELDRIKRKELLQKSYVKKQGIKIEELSSAIALDSLLEASKIASGTEKTNEAISFAEKALAELKSHLPEHFVATELKNRQAINRFEAKNKKEFKHYEKKAGEEKIWKSNAICKNYSFAARAENRKELNELIDSNVRIIEFKEKNE